MKKLSIVMLVLLLSFVWVVTDAPPLQPTAADAWSDSGSGKDCRSTGKKVGLRIDGYEYNPLGGVTLQNAGVSYYDYGIGNFKYVGLGSPSINGGGLRIYATVYTGKSRVGTYAASGSFNWYDAMFESGTDLWAFCYG